MHAELHADRSLTGRSAFVTGASRGVGAAVARAFAQGGARVGLLSRSGDDLGLPGAVGVRCDVSKRDDVFAAVEEVVAQLGGLECVVALPGRVGDTPVELEPGRYVDFYARARDWAAAGAPPPVDPADSVRVLEVLEGDSVGCQPRRRRAITLA